MLSVAQKSREAMPADQAQQLCFSHADARCFRLTESFDVAVSLFHVMSYQISNEDLIQAFETAHSHLKKGGVFIFDCWYGPAVIADRPRVRVKRIRDRDIEILRIADPLMHPNENVVDVNYRILIIDKVTNVTRELNERHRMRYLFKPEVDFFLRATKFSLVCCLEFLTDRRPGLNTWNVYFVAAK
jgi:SAM-dependent methyltransferase